MDMNTTSTPEEEDDEAFLRSLVLPEEDRLRRYPTMKWSGGYRWFRSPNVIPIEKYRRLRQLSTPDDEQEAL
jgi:hypothetical protein